MDCLALLERQCRELGWTAYELKVATRTDALGRLRYDVRLFTEDKYITAGSGYSLPAATRHLAEFLRSMRDAYQNNRMVRDVGDWSELDEEEEMRAENLREWATAEICS